MSGEEGHIKGRAEYQNMTNQYCIHDLTGCCECERLIFSNQYFAAECCRQYKNGHSPSSEASMR